MKIRASWTLLSAIAVGSGVAACGGDRGPAAGTVTVDTVGSTVVVTNPERSVPSGDAAIARQAFLIGEVEGAPHYTFGSISSIAVDRSGHLYVSDVMADEVRAYGPGGAFVARIGRRGDGPGEFRRPTGLAVSDGGVLYVRDETRVQRFAPAAPGAPASRYAGSHPGPAYAYSTMTTRLDTAGRLYYPMRAGRIPGQRYFYLVFDPAGTLLDTLSLPETVRVPSETAILRTGPSGGRVVPGLSRAPFAPVPAWDVTREGRLLVSTGEAYALAEVDGTGDTVRVIRQAGSAAPVPAAEREDSLRAVRERMAAAPAPAGRLEGVAEEIRRGDLPETLPPVLGIHVGTDGRIWVERWPDGGGSAYDAFTREGAYERTIRLPLRLESLPAPVFTSSRVYGVVIDPETEVQRVAAYELSPSLAAGRPLEGLEER